MLIALFWGSDDIHLLRSRYANLIVEGKASVNVFAFDDNSADAWERGRY